jgi:bifunctional DNA-binding transcriptional regulator/antitoxin component of YhaV-PrlF toxin-antitoxin module
MEVRMTSTMSEKGQITISKEIREELGVGQGWRALQRRVGDHVEIHFLPPRHRRSLRGALADGTRRVETEDEFSRAGEEAWAAGARREDDP